MLVHAHEFGWDSSCWNEDVLGEKQIHDGHQHGSCSSAWSRRLVVTEESESLMLKHCHQLLESTPKVLRRKFQQEHAIRISVIACFASSCICDLQTIGFDQKTLDGVAGNHHKRHEFRFGAVQCN